MPLFRPKEEDTKLNFLIQYKNELLIIKESTNFLYTLQEIDLLCILVDDLSLITDVILDSIYKRKYKAFVFVNSKYMPDQFVSILQKKISKYFIDREINKCSIVYGHYNFPQKNKITKISEFRLSNESKIQYEFSNPILYIGQYGTSGYATAAKGYVANYVINNIPINWEPLYFDDSKLDKSFYVDVLAESAINYDIGKNFKSTTAIVHCTPDLYPKMIQEKDLSKYKTKIGYCTWESTKLPLSWPRYINTMDEIWVPSKFNKECFINSKVKIPIKVVPHVWFNQNLFEKKNIKIHDLMGNLIPNNKYTFYTIGEFIERKGILDTIKIFDKLYEKNNNIQLIIKTHFKEHNSKNMSYIIDSIKKITTNLGKSIYLIIKNVSNLELICIHSLGDCYISLTRAEGFGLTIFEAFNYKKSIVATGYSGHVDFLGIEYEGLVNYELKNVTGMENFSKYYTKDQKWAIPNLDHAYSLIENKIL